MTPLTKSQGTESSRWAAIAAILLLGLGLLVAGFGVVLTAQGLALHAPEAPGFGGFAAGIGVVVLAIGILHVVAAISIWAHRAWAGYLGIILGVLGVLVGANHLPGAFDSTYVSSNGGDAVLTPPAMGSIVSGLVLFPYLVVLIGLVLTRARRCDVLHNS